MSAKVPQNNEIWIKIAYKKPPAETFTDFLFFLIILGKTPKWTKLVDNGVPGGASASEQ